jgi:four helix bundle protein
LPATIEPPVGRVPAEFIAKIGVVEEEADESAFWLELIVAHRLMQETLVRPLLNEADELTAIMAASRISASQNLKQSAIANRKSPI